MAERPSKVQGVLFDIDGTLVDSTYLHTVCWWQALRMAGHDAPMARIHRAVGMGAERLVPEALGDGHDDEVDELAASHDALYSTYWAQLRPLPGARALLDRCHAQGLTVVLASSATQREVDVLGRVLDAAALVDFTTSSDDADSSKPAPDIVEVALAKAGLEPDQATFVGDAVWDVQAAAKAGVACIGLECGGTGEAELREAGAIAVYQDPAALLSHFTNHF